MLSMLAAGESATVVLSGEPGVGKTALIRELLGRGRECGYQTLDGRAAEFERDLPFAVILDALEDSVDSLAPERRQLIDAEDLGLLATIFPSLGRLAGGPRPAQSDDRQRLLRALHALPQLLAGDRPLVLALDDLQWADPASVDLVCRLLHRGLGAGSLLLLASRPGQSQPRLQAAFGEAERHGQALQIELAALSAVDAERLLGDDLDPALREALYRESGGNPFYLEQLAASSRRVEARTRETSAPVDVGVPQGVSSAIRAELDILSPSARNLLQGAAIVGDPFEPDLAAEAAAVLPKDALGDLDELLGCDLIRTTDSPRRFCFRHPIVRHAVYEAAGPGWRLRAHGHVAAVLEARGAAATVRAPHIERSAQGADATSMAVLVEAGQELALRAPASAAHWFDAALRLIPEQEENLDLRLGLLAQRAAALLLAGQLEESRDELRRFLRLGRPEPSELRVQTAILSATVDELLGTHVVGRRLLLEELAKLPDQDCSRAADLKRELACTFCMDADWAKTRRYARGSLAGDCQGVVRVGALAILAMAEFGRGNSTEAGRSVSEAAELFDRLTDEEVGGHRLSVAAWLGGAEAGAERLADALRHTHRAVIVAGTASQPGIVPLLAGYAQALEFVGRVAELAAVAETATEAALLSASDLNLSWAMTVRSRASLLIGDTQAAMRFSELGAGVNAATTSPLFGVARAQLAEVSLEMGEPERCRDQLTDADGELWLPPYPPYFEVLACELLTRAEIALGDLARAEEFAQRALERATRLGTGLSLAFARRARALLLIERGDMRSAATEALASCESAEQIGAPVEAARSQMLAGKALAASGERPAATAALRSAHETLLACGAFRYSDQAAQELRKLGRAVPRRNGARNTGASILGLTDRECEVMEQVAAGRTNRDIAHDLFLSVRTVDRHVARIFEKLDVNSRVSASSAFERARNRLSS